MKYHISKNGVPAKCNAKYKCPIGGEHFDSEESCQKACDKIASKHDVFIARLQGDAEKPNVYKRAKRVKFNGDSYSSSFRLYAAIASQEDGDFEADVKAQKKTLGGAIGLASEQYPLAQFTPLSAATFNDNRESFIVDSYSADNTDTNEMHIANSYESVTEDDELVAYYDGAGQAHAVSFMKLWCDKLDKQGISKDMLADAESVGVKVKELWSKYEDNKIQVRVGEL
jgi:hypothetical protein